MKNRLFFILIGVLSWACKKAPEPLISITQDSYEESLIVLNEGLFNSNTATISSYEKLEGSTQKEVFESVNSTRLGDTGNDILRFGSQIYLVLSGSHQLVVLNARTLKESKRIQLLDGLSNGASPRKMTVWQDKVVISQFDGNLAVLDTTSLTISKRIEVGNDPDGISSEGNFVIVANSGGLDFPNYDSTVSIVNMTTQVELRKVVVGLNPSQVLVTGTNNFWVISNGNYGSIPSTLKSIDISTDQVTELSSGEVLSITADNLYGYVLKSSSNPVAIEKRLLSTGTLTKTVNISLPNLRTAYRIGWLRGSNELYLTDANQYSSSGRAYLLDTSLNFRTQFSTGLIPTKIIENIQ